MDFPELPECLRITAEARKAMWKGKRPRSLNAMNLTIKTKDEPADVKAFRLEQERRAKAKRVEVFKMLAARKAEKKAGR